MTDARALLYANARWLVDRMLSDAERPPIDWANVTAIGEFLHGLLDDLEADESVPLGDRFPALERWRAQMIDAAGRRPLERAAAWELTAMTCEHDGATALVAVALDNARRALDNRRVA